MTVSTTTTKVIYNGDGATTAFPTTFEFFDAADIEVIERVVTTGAETVKTLTTDYTVSGGAGATGTVTAVTALPATVQWVIRRVTPLTQLIDYVENDDFPAETHEKGLDLAVMRAQERKGELDRAAKFPVSDPASSIGEIPNSTIRASQFLGFDANGKPIAAAGTSADLGPVSAFINTLLDDADAATARGTLGAAADTSAGVKTKTASYTVAVGDKNELHLLDGTSAVVTATLPPAATAGDGFRISFKAINVTNALTIDGDGAETIDGVASITLDVVQDTVKLICDGTNWHIESDKDRPALDGTSLKRGASGLKRDVPHSRKTTAYTFVAADVGTFVELDHAGAVTHPITAAATLGNGWFADIHNSGAGEATLDPNGAELINDATTLVLKQGQGGRLHCDGTSLWFVQGVSALRREFRSPDQTITSGGSLTIAHGLGAKPRNIEVWLKNTIAQSGYVANDEVLATPCTHGAISNSGVSMIADATNIVVRFGSNAKAMALNDATTGAGFGITNGSWKAIFVARL